MHLARLLVLVAALGCGRVGFGIADDAGSGGGDGSTPPPGYYLSPTGDDNAAGTHAAPWKTFHHALGKLTPGDTLVLHDGQYDASNAGEFAANCQAGATSCGGGACQSGSESAPIVVRALNSRQARLRVETSALILRCRFWQLDGLTITGYANATGESPLYVWYSTNIQLRNLLLAAPSPNGRGHGLLIDDSSDVLVEDSEIYDFHRWAITAGHSTRITIRRVYANSRGREDGSYGTTCPETGEGFFQSWWSSHVTLENVLGEELCAGVKIIAGTQENRGTSNTDIGDNHWVGHSAFLAWNGATEPAVHIESDCGMACGNSDNIAANNTFENVAFIGFDRGLTMAGEANRIHASTVYTQAARNSDFAASLKRDSASHTTARGVVEGLLSVGYGTGVSVSNQANYAVYDVNANGAITPFSADANPGISDGIATLDAALGTCRLQLPQGSDLRTRSPRGHRIGADIRMRSQNRVETTTPLWNPGFPCGAKVTGLSDGTKACANAHERVGKLGC